MVIAGDAAGAGNGPFAEFIAVKAPPFGGSRSIEDQDLHPS